MNLRYFSHCSYLIAIAFKAVLFLNAAPEAHAALPPKAPTGVTAATTITNTQFPWFLVRWEDKSFDETGFALYYRSIDSSGQPRPASWSSAPLWMTVDPGSTFAVDFIGDSIPQGTRFQFAVRAYKITSDGAVIFSPLAESSLTGVVVSSFDDTAPVGANAPTDLTISNVTDTDGSFNVAWTDNWTQEERNILEFKLSAEADTAYKTASVIQGPWVLGSPFFGFTPIAAAELGLKPGSIYNLRMRAGRRSGTTNYFNLSSFTQFTGYSNVVTLTVPALKAPTNAAATPTAEATVRVTWDDNSTNEGDFYKPNTTDRNKGGYVVSWRIPGDANYGTFQEIEPDDSSSYDAWPPNFESVSMFAVPGVTNEWQIKARHRHGAETNIVDSAAITATATPPFYNPTRLEAVVNSSASVSLRWQDNSAVEAGYSIEARQGTAAFSEVGTVGTTANTTQEVQTTVALPAGEASDIRVRAIYIIDSNLFYSGYSDVVSVTTPEGITSKDRHPATRGVAIATYNLEVGDVANVVSAAVTGLPPGLTYTAGSATTGTVVGTVTGTPTVSGLFVAKMSVVFTGGRRENQNLTFRILEPLAAPLRLAESTDLTIPRSEITIPLAQFFSDPDTTSAVQVDVGPFGNIKIALFDELTPLTVANFMAYVNAGDYNGSVFHRVSPDFVIQGGGYKPLTTEGPTYFEEVTRRESPLNEPGIPNLAGTIALARGAGVNSGTHDFFVSLADNRSILDESNGGFTVFGRLAGHGNASTVTNSTLTTLATKPGRDDYVINLKPSGSTSFTSTAPIAGGNLGVGTKWPINDTIAPTTMENSKVIQMQVTKIDTLSFDVTNSNPSGVTHSVSSGVLSLTGVTDAETATITVTATDVDGGTTTHTFNVTVTDGVTPPSISAQLANVTVNAGESATFSASVTGSNLRFFWKKDGTIIPGESANTLTILDAERADEGEYQLFILGDNGAVASTVARLTVNSPPEVTIQPAPISIPYGGTATFSVEAVGSPTLTYQWRLNGAPITGATSATLTLSPVNLNTVGDYSCVVTNSYGSDESAVAYLTVLDRDTDGDGLKDGQEDIKGTDRWVTDTDGDGYSDGSEVAYGSDPKNKARTPAATHVIAQAEREQLLRGMKMSPVPNTTDFTDKLSISGPVAVGTWLATYELSNAEWAAVLQHGKEKMGIVSVVTVGSDVVAKAYDKILCHLPTHDAPDDAGHLGEDEVGISADLTTFVVPRDVANHPARGVTWYGAYLAAHVMNNFYQYNSVMNPSAFTFNFAQHGFIIPKNHEWEYAARNGGALTAFPTGGSISATKANYLPTAFGKPKPVASYAPSAIGFFNLAGNVAEWVFDEASATEARTRGGSYATAEAATSNNTEPPALNRETIDPTVGVRLSLFDPNAVGFSQDLAAHKLVATGKTLELSISPSGFKPISVTWFKNNKVIKGQAGRTLSIPNAKMSDAGKYRARITSGLGSADSIVCNVMMIDGTGGLRYVPSEGSVTLATRTSPAVGGTFSYRWRYNGTKFSPDNTPASDELPYEDVYAPPYVSDPAKSSLKVTDSVRATSGYYDCQVTFTPTTGAAISETGGVTLLVFVEKPVPLAPSVTSAGVVGGFLYRVVQYNSNYDSPTRYTISGLPKGLVYNPVTGEIFGFPEVGGSFQIRVVATNAKGSSAPLFFNLVINPFPPHAVGAYAGSIAPETAVNGNLGGHFRVDVAKNGAYTGSVVLGNTTHRISGVAIPSAVTSQSAVDIRYVIERDDPLNDVDFRLTLTPTVVSNVVTKTLVTGTAGVIIPPATSSLSAVAVSGWRNLWPGYLNGSLVGAPLLGRLTKPYHSHLSIPATAELDPASPQGEGFIVTQLKTDGSTSSVCRAGDGSVFTSASLMGPEGQVLYYGAPYGEFGSLSGTLSIAVNGNVTGTGRWLKKHLGATSTERNYKEGFGPLTLTAAGAMYSRPTAGSVVVGLTTAANRMQVTFAPLGLNTGGTALEGTETSNFTLKLNHSVVFQPNETRLRALTIDPAKGTFTGKAEFGLGANKRAVDFFGLFIPGEAKGYGYFLIPQSSTPATSPLISSQVVIETDPTP